MSLQGLQLPPLRSAGTTEVREVETPGQGNFWLWHQEQGNTMMKVMVGVRGQTEGNRETGTNLWTVILEPLGNFPENSHRRQKPDRESFHPPCSDSRSVTGHTSWVIRGFLSKPLPVAIHSTTWRKT